MGFPEQFTNRVSPSFPFVSCSLASLRYRVSASFALLPKGTALSFIPSLQIIYPRRRFRSDSFREISSETRIPVAYSSYSMALSLISLGASLPGCSRSLAASSTVSTSGAFFSILGAFKRSVTSSETIPFLSIK